VHSPIYQLNDYIVTYSTNFIKCTNAESKNLTFQDIVLSIEKMALKLRQDSASAKVLNNEEYVAFVEKARTDKIINLVGETSGNTALHFAVIHQQYEKALTLIQKGNANYLIENNKKQTAYSLVEKDTSTNTDLMALKKLMGIKLQPSTPSPGGMAGP
jgi:hypothetical protein